MEKLSVNVIMATHKKVDFNVPNYIKKMQVNASKQESLWEGYIYDNTGINISDKNYCFSELTGLYWLWKNSSDDIKGICHYRRIFTKEYTDTMISGIDILPNQLNKFCLEEKKIRMIMEDGIDIILPKPYLPYPKTVFEELNTYVYSKDIEILKEVIKTNYTDYYDVLMGILENHQACYFNMMIANKKVFDDYCEWLFDILFKVELKCDITQYDTQHKRLYGYLSEVLLNVYIIKNNLKVRTFKLGFVQESLPIKSKILVMIKQIRNEIHNYLKYHGHYTGIEKISKILFKQVYKRYIKCIEFEKNYLNND